MLLLAPYGGVSGLVGLVGDTAAHNFGAQRFIARRADFDHQAEPIQQLRAQIALFQVHRAYQRKSRRMRHRQAFALHRVDAHRRRIQQHIDQMIRQQVDFVYIKYAPMRGGQQARLKYALRAFQRPLQIQRADDAVFGSA